MGTGVLRTNTPESPARPHQPNPHPRTRTRHCVHALREKRANAGKRSRFLHRRRIVHQQHAGKRITSRQCRVERSLGKTPTTLLPLWIRRIVNDDNPLTLKTIDSKSLLIQTMLTPAHAPPVKTNSLVDSGCSARGFADRKFCKDNNIPTLLLPKPRLVLLADGKAASKITDYFVTKIAVGNHTETCVFFVTTLTADNPIILGLPWLQRHNPTIDWRSMSITFQSPYCLRHCCTAPCTATTVPCPTREPHDVIIPGEPRLQQYQATVEDEPPEERKTRPRRTEPRYRTGNQPNTNTRTGPLYHTPDCRRTGTRNPCENDPQSRYTKAHNENRRLPPCNPDPRKTAPAQRTYTQTTRPQRPDHPGRAARYDRHPHNHRSKFPSVLQVARNSVYEDDMGRARCLDPPSPTETPSAPRPPRRRVPAGS